MEQPGEHSNAKTPVQQTQNTTLLDTGQEEKPLLTVYSFDANPQRYSYSPFVTKLHFRLRYSGIPYINKFGSWFQAPKGKIPYVEFHETGEILGDSGLIVQRLVAMDAAVDRGSLGKNPSFLGDCDIKSGLGVRERAMDYCLRKAVEEGGYFVTLYERWYDNYYAMRDRGPFSGLPWGIRHVVAALAYRYARVILYMQGAGRYTASEVTGLREEMIGMLADFAEAARRRRNSHQDVDSDNEESEEEPFWILGGEKATEADFTIFGYLSGLLATVTQPATTALIKTHPALIEYVRGIHRRYFPDFELPDLAVAGKDHVE